MKHMTMPDVKIVRFENKDLIVTSPSLTNEVGYQDDIETGGLVQGRNSLWD